MVIADSVGFNHATGSNHVLDFARYGVEPFKRTGVLGLDRQNRGLTYVAGGRGLSVELLQALRRDKTWLRRSAMSRELAHIRTLGPNSAIFAIQILPKVSDQTYELQSAILESYHPFSKISRYPAERSYIRVALP